MRKVETQMLNAIRAGKSGSFGNTAVTVGPLGQWTVTLHGNKIASGGSQTFSVTLADWNTPTTRSRVNALLSGLLASEGLWASAYVTTKNGQAQLESRDRAPRKVTDTQWIGPFQRKRDALTETIAETTGEAFAVVDMMGDTPKAASMNVGQFHNYLKNVLGEE